ncbi:hypothetical protein HZA97_06680 [Candidatus Woesearchaeota archaeon]|nr:hypothetical protein [Candidatus Woesearchaeota archaeon]
MSLDTNGIVKLIVQYKGRNEIDCFMGFREDKSGFRIDFDPYAIEGDELEAKLFSLGADVTQINRDGSVWTYEKLSDVARVMPENNNSIARILEYVILSRSS